jgi:hypothetical protein
MTRDDIIRMAREAGAYEKYGVLFLLPEDLERFAALALAAKKPDVAIAEAYRCGEEAGRAAEREACAQVAVNARVDDASNYPLHIAAAIRARGQE